MKVHRALADTLDTVTEEILAIRKHARETGDTTRPIYPMIVLRTPKGWTGPKNVDGKQIEGSFRAHQVPLMMDSPEHLPMLEAVAAQLPSGGAVRRKRQADSRTQGTGADRRAPHRRKPARQRRFAHAPVCACRISAITD